MSLLLLFAAGKSILSSMSPEIVFRISFIAGNSLEIFIKFPVTGNCLEIHKHINLCSGTKYRVEPQTTFAERSGSPPKRRTPKIRKFVFCIVVIYALFERIVELSRKVILLSESFTSKTTNFDAIVKQSFCCENLQIFALIKGWGWLLRSPKAANLCHAFWILLSLQWNALKENLQGSKEIIALKESSNSNQSLLNMHECKKLLLEQNAWLNHK